MQKVDSQLLQQRRFSRVARGTESGNDPGRKFTTHIARNIKMRPKHRVHRAHIGTGNRGLLVSRVGVIGLVELHIIRGVLLVVCHFQGMC